MFKVGINSEQGFTVLELITTVVIVSILAGITFLSARIHLQNTREAVAESVLTSASKAFSVVLTDRELPIPAIPLEISDTDGSALDGNLETYFDDLSIPPDYQVSLVHTPCLSSIGVNVRITSQACKTSTVFTWIKLCNLLTMTTKSTGTLGCGVLPVPTVPPLIPLPPILP